LTALAAATLPPSDARACGGCFSLQSESQSTVVSGHRMAFALSTTQTVLWDQIKYSGAPSEFAWVLPVRAGAVVELSNDAWFETLEAATAAQVVSPTFNCTPPNGGGCNIGCGSSASARYFAGSGEANGPPAVTVTHEGTVGPYETVTLHANVPDALPAWLTAHHYNIDPSVSPVIDAYTSEGFDFIALRLLPGQGVQQMKPVRVVTPGSSPSLPLRMVAAGTGPQVAITLFIVGEGRWEAQNFPNGQVEPDNLTWDFGTQSSDYDTQRQALMAQNGGTTWNNAFAHQGSLLSQDFINGRGTSIQVGGQFASTFADAYVLQGVADGEGSLGAVQASTCSTTIASFANSMERVSGACLAQGGGGPDGGAGTGGSGTGGSGTGGSGTGGSVPCSVPSSEIDASLLACGGLDDIAVALVGMHPQSVWLTRLEANLPHARLSTDLVVQASAQQTDISNVLTLTRSKGDPCAPTGGTVSLGGGRDGLAAARRNQVAMLAAALAAIGAVLARRRRRAPALVPVRTS
jgi:hypothetical protein